MQQLTEWVRALAWQPCVDAGALPSVNDAVKATATAHPPLDTAVKNCHWPVPGKGLLRLDGCIGLPQRLLQILLDVLEAQVPKLI